MEVIEGTAAELNPVWERIGASGAGEGIKSVWGLWEVSAERTTLK